MVTKQERDNLKDKSGLVYIPSKDRVINTHSIVDIAAEEDAEIDRKRNRGKNMEGILHDGTPVIKHFGNWYIKGDMIEENGKMVPAVLIDINYYPEVAMDCIPSSEEYFTKYAEIENREERLKLICGKNYKNYAAKSLEFKSIKELSSGKYGFTSPKTL